MYMKPCLYIINTSDNGKSEVGQITKNLLPSSVIVFPVQVYYAPIFIENNRYIMLHTAEPVVCPPIGSSNTFLNDYNGINVLI